MRYTLHNEQVKQNCIKAIQAIDVSVSPVMEVEICLFSKPRTDEQNKLMWSGLLADFSTQGILFGRQFSTMVWHEHLKEKFLPEQYKKGITKKNYIKWIEMPNGQLKLIGSTKDLTTKGFGCYLETLYHYGAYELEIKFRASPGQGY